MARCVAYYRISIREQGNSGLGLDVQRNSVPAYVHNDHGITAEFTEVESIAEAKRMRARLVIAKIDRLSCDAAFIFAPGNSATDFICTATPNTNTLTIGIFTTLAQHEREIIRQRTLAALAAAEYIRLFHPL